MLGTSTWKILPREMHECSSWLAMERSDDDSKLPRGNARLTGLMAMTSFEMASASGDTVTSLTDSFPSCRAMICPMASSMCSRRCERLCSWPNLFLRETQERALAQHISQVRRGSGRGSLGLGLLLAASHAVKGACEVVVSTPVAGGFLVILFALDLGVLDAMFCGSIDIEPHLRTLRL